ncbi:hypothetical protein [Asticcacaulis sp. AC460]|uniref:hypothetical protein n=1 Tax=Asticcacaulis sp. AC460 TaxID=1282360 RepID=UPI00138AF532|nr:hypothetical protein [Asticcacaulis sp. AC460]
MFDRDGGKTAAISLSYHETELVLAIEKAAPYTPGKDVALSAAALRAIFLGLPVLLDKASTARSVGLTSSGVTIVDATITGSLDLVGVRASDGGPAVPLVLKECRFDGVIDVSRAHFRYLSLEQSAFPALLARDVFVDGPLQLSHVRGDQNSREGTQVSLDGGRINGALYAEDSYFSGHDTDAFYARNLRVSGHASFSNSSFEVYGSGDEKQRPAHRALVIPDAKIDGDLQLDGCHFLHCGEWTSHPVSLILADNAVVSGNIGLDHSILDADFGATGDPSADIPLRICFNNAKIGGFFSIDNTTLRCSIRASGIEIGGNLSLVSTTIYGYVFAPNSQIGGNLKITQTCINISANFYLSNITGDLRIGQIYTSITSILYGNFQSINVNGNLIIANSVFKQFDFGGAVVFGTFEVEKNRPLRRSSILSPTSGNYELSLDLKSIYFFNENIFVNPLKKYAYSGQYYYDFGKEVYGIFNDISKSVAEKLNADTIGISRNEFGYKICSLTFNHDSNDYDDSLIDNPEFLPVFSKTCVENISHFEAVRFARYCLQNTEQIDKSTFQAASDFLQPGRSLKYTRKRFSETFGEAYGKVFIDFYIWMIRTHLKFDQWNHLPDWTSLEASANRDEWNWLINGTQVRELADESGEGYGNGRLFLDEFKYDFIRDPSFDGSIHATSPTDGTFKVPSRVLLRQLAAHKLRNALASAQQKLRATRLDVLVDGLLLGGFAFLLFFEPVRRLLPWEFRKSHDLLHGAFPHLPIALGILVPLVLLAIFLNTSLKRSIHAMRKNWLDKQYVIKSQPTKDEIRPFPYEQLAKYLRARGYDTESRKILISKLKLEHRLKTFVLLRPVLLLYRWGFDYGLSPQRAIWTFLVFLFIGWLGFLIADRGYIAEIERPKSANLVPVYNVLKGTKRKPVMVIATSTVNTAIVSTRNETSEKFAAGMVASRENAKLPQQLDCGTSIQPSLYAIDVFIPAIDLRQESQCEISSEPKAAAWRWAKAIYSILGWIITSLTILTISGILRRQVEN